MRRVGVVSVHLPACGDSQSGANQRLPTAGVDGRSLAGGRPDRRDHSAILWRQRPCRRGFFAARGVRAPNLNPNCQQQERRHADCPLLTRPSYSPVSLSNPGWCGQADRVKPINGQALPIDSGSAALCCCIRLALATRQKEAPARRSAGEQHAGQPGHHQRSDPADHHRSYRTPPLRGQGRSQTRQTRSSTRRQTASVLLRSPVRAFSGGVASCRMLAPDHHAHHVTRARDHRAPADRSTSSSTRRKTIVGDLMQSPRRIASPLPRIVFLTGRTVITSDTVSAPSAGIARRIPNSPGTGVQDILRVDRQCGASRQRHPVPQISPGEIRLPAGASPPHIPGSPPASSP